MQPSPTKIRPPKKHHGGKGYTARRIVRLMPELRTYCEPFVGAGSVLLNKPRCEREVAGDIDPRLIGMWRAIQDPSGDFIRLLDQIPYTRDSFNWAGLPSDPGLDDAVRYLVRSRFSRGGLGQTFAWSERQRGGKPGDENAWDTIRAEMPAIGDRVRGVIFHCRPALKLIDDFRSDAESLIYLDPPYLLETRTAPSAYEFELTPRPAGRGPAAKQAWIDEDRARHMTLLGAIRECRGAVLISGYPSELYDSALAGWSRVEIDIANHAGQGASKQRRTECVWSNRSIAV